MDAEVVEYRGKLLEVVELFQDCVILQCSESKELFTVRYHDLYPSPNDIKCLLGDNNVISLRAWKSWPGNAKNVKKKNPK